VNGEESGESAATLEGLCELAGGYAAAWHLDVPSAVNPEVVTVCADTRFVRGLRVPRRYWWLESSETRRIL
jgi:hypothetical protein